MSGNEHFRKQTKAVFLAIILTLLISSPLSAAKEAPPDIITAVDQNQVDSHSTQMPVNTTAVVSALRREVPIEKATRFVTVITREQIERSGKTFVLDLLRGTPGLSMNQSGPAGRVAQINLRGTNANHTLVLLDNVQINSPTTGQASQATLERLTTNNIERIEIIRGPQSVLYGADAVGGVINIITKPDQRKGVHGNASFEYGTYETFYEGGEVSMNHGRISLSGGGTRFDSEGPGINDGHQNTSANAHGVVQVTDNSDLDVAFHYTNSISGIDDGAFRQDPNSSSRSRTQVMNNRYTIAPAGWWEHYFQYSFFHNALFSFDPRNPGAAGGDPESVFKLDADIHTFETQSIFYLGDVDVITLGYEFEHTNANVKRSQASGGFEQTRRNHGWFLQNELFLWDVWTVVTGVRFDENEFFGSEVSPLVSTSYQVEQTGTRLKGSFGKAFKAPTFNELFFPGFGNATLQAEESWGWDVGFEQPYWDGKGLLTAAYFHNEIDNLIEFVSMNGVFSAFNVAAARTQGVELENRIEITEDLSLYANYTYTNAIDRESDNFLERIPRHQGKIGLAYDWKRLHFNADWILTGARQQANGGALVKNDGYTRLDLAAVFEVTDHFQIFSRVENATNDHYMETLGFENPSTRFVAGAKVEV